TPSTCSARSIVRVMAPPPSRSTTWPRSSGTGSRKRQDEQDRTFGVRKGTRRRRAVEGGAGRARPLRDRPGRRRTSGRGDEARHRHGAPGGTPRRLPGRRNTASGPARGRCPQHHGRDGTIIGPWWDIAPTARDTGGRTTVEPEPRGRTGVLRHLGARPLLPARTGGTYTLPRRTVPVQHQKTGRPREPGGPGSHRTQLR